MEMALHQLMVWAEKALDQQEIALGIFLDTEGAQEMALGIFLDIEGAFNNTSYDSKFSTLARHGVDYTIVRWIRATLEGQLATMTLGGFSRSVRMSRGCPQEGVSSLLL